VLNSYPHNTDTLLYPIDVIRLDYPGPDRYNLRFQDIISTGVVKIYSLDNFDVFRLFYKSSNEWHITLLSW